MNKFSSFMRFVSFLWVDYVENYYCEKISAFSYFLFIFFSVKLPPAFTYFYEFISLLILFSDNLDSSYFYEILDKVGNCVPFWILSECLDNFLLSIYFATRLLSSYSAIYFSFSSCSLLIFCLYESFCFNCFVFSD